jgi:coniferyl-aldehyde dehydrogenase
MSHLDIQTPESADLTLIQPERPMNMTAKIISFANDTEHLQQLFETQKTAAREAPFPSLADRLAQLNKLEKLLDAYEDRFVEAISDDFGQRATFETRLTEFFVLRLALSHTRKHLKGWMKHRSVHTNILFKPGKSSILPQPLGVVGIIAPWNFPLQLIIAPLITALAAGNRAILKPRELSPRFGDVLNEAVTAHFDADVVAVVRGEADLAQAMTNLPFDHLVFTGSTEVGRKVAQAAAANLTPVTLELGGKSPAIIDDSADMTRAVRRIVKGKLNNAGQICIAPDYLLVPEGKVEAIAAQLLKVAREMYPDWQGNSDATSVISEGHLTRLQGLVKDAKEKGANVQTAHADRSTPSSRMMPLTIITQATPDMAVMQEEIFGPILPVIGVKSHKDAIAFVQDRARPLALYWFGTDTVRRDEILTQVHAGGVTINDTLMHILQANLPFGGVGDSGIGNYHGRDGFERLSHMKAVYTQAKYTATDLLGAPFTPFVKRMLKITEALGRR